MNMTRNVYSRTWWEERTEGVSLGAWPRLLISPAELTPGSGPSFAAFCEGWEAVRSLNFKRLTPVNLPLKVAPPRSLHSRRQLEQSTATTASAAFATLSGAAVEVAFKVADERTERIFTVRASREIEKYSFLASLIYLKNCAATHEG